MHDDNDKELGMGRPIARRDFIHGVAAGAGALGVSGLMPSAALAGTAPLPIIPPGDYPPAATGLRGQYPGSFEMAHAARDGQIPEDVSGEDTDQPYDLVIVGGGISGLSAAHFYRKALGDDRRILILDNHDDFGGHAKRNEFSHKGRTYLSYGGTMSIETPFPYSYTAKTLIREIGIDVAAYGRYLHEEQYQGLGRGYFFDKEHFRADRLVVAPPGQANWQSLFSTAPLSPAGRDDLIRLHVEKRDYLPGMSPDEKAALLKTISYQDFLTRHAGALPEVLPFFAGRGFRNNMRMDCCPAYTAAKLGAPGFQGMEIGGGPAFHSDYEFHFPDGNATIARLLVNRLIPDAFDGQFDAEGIVAQRVRYDRLDNPANPTRIRLSSMVIKVEHEGDPKNARAVSLIYVRGGKRYRVRGAHVVMACFNNILPFIVKDMPEDQKTALRYPSKVPMLYTNVLVRNWEAWKKLKVRSIYASNAYHPNMSLDIPVSMGAYRFPDNPAEPIVVHMVRNPNSPGLPRRDQNRAGRAEMLATPFSDIERAIRSDMGRQLGGGGFDPARDILAITANRWPHGYAYTYDSIGDPDMPDNERPHVLGRRPFGRITIANADAGASAFTNVAIDQAERAIGETLISMGLT